MSRRHECEEYEENFKNVETVTGIIEENDTDYEDDNILTYELENYEDTENIYRMTQALKEYSKSQGLPLCHYLNPGLLAEFINSDV